MGPRIKAFLLVLSAIAISLLAIVAAIRLLAPRTLIFCALGGTAVVALALWARSRRVCCYICRGSVAGGSEVYSFKGRRRLVCLSCVQLQSRLANNGERGGANKTN